MKRNYLYSLGLHAIALLAVLLHPKFSPLTPSTENVEVETISENDFEKMLKKGFKDREKQIVIIDERLSNGEAPKKDTKEEIFYSSKDQQAEKNTRAAKVGKFKNSDKQKASPSGENEAKAKVAQLFALSEDPEALISPQEKEKSKKSTGRLRGPASIDEESATDDYLEDVAIGVETILNAKEYKFFSFYKRVREQLIHHWHTQLKKEIHKLESQGRPIVNQERKTKLRVFLNPAGVLTHIQILGSSGVDELDRAATDAFRLATPFPHPPRQMLNEDKLVTIRWEFVVVSSGNSPVQLKVRRTGYR